MSNLNLSISGFAMKAGENISTAPTKTITAFLTANFFTCSVASPSHLVEIGDYDRFVE
jgi:hypothetical protein